MPLESLPPDEPIPTRNAFRHLLVFQLKLVFDAVRDLLFSPVSLIAFIIDSIMRPAVKDSFSYRLMHVGRRSDRIINLFDEYTGSGDYTIDETVAEVEVVLQRELNKNSAKKSPASQKNNHRL